MAETYPPVFKHLHISIEINLQLCFDTLNFVIGLVVFLIYTSLRLW